MPTKFSSGIRTPNLPSSPQASLTREERSEAPSSAGAPISKLQMLPPERKIPAPHPNIQRSTLPSGSVALQKHKDILTSSSNSSLESCTSGEIKLANSTNIDQTVSSSKVKTQLSEKKPHSLQLSGERSGQDKQGFAKGGEILSPPAEFKLLGEESESSPKKEIFRYFRRISPEGMSHEDQGSPREGDQKIRKQGSRTELEK